MRLAVIALSLAVTGHGLALAVSRGGLPEAACLQDRQPGLDCAHGDDAALATARAALDRGDFANAAVAAECVMRGGTQPGLQALHIAAQARIALGCHAQAEALLRSALTRRPTRADAGKAWLLLGDLHERRKLHAQARADYLRGIRLLDTEADADSHAEALLRLGDLETVRGDYEAAFRAYGEASEQAHDPEIRSRALDHRGYGYRTLGNNTVALELHEQALRTAAGIADPPARARAQARARNHIGINWQALAQAAVLRGDRDQAGLDLQRAIAAEEAGVQALGAGGDPASIDARRLGYLLRATSDMELMLAQADPSRQSEHLGRALGAAREAHRIANDRSGELEWKGLALHRLGIALARTGDPVAARAAFDEAIRIWTQSGDIYSLGMARRFAADEIDTPAGNLDAARAGDEEAFALFETIDAEDDMAQAQLAIGRIEERAGRPEAARAAYLRAIDLVEHMRSRLVHDEHKLAFLARRMAPYDALLRLLMHEYRDHGNRSDAQAAFDVAERAQGRVLLDMIESAGDRLDARIDAPALHQERRLRRDVEQARAKLQETRQPAAMVRARADLDRAKQALRAWREELALRDPRYAELTGARLIPLTRLHDAAIGVHEVMLRYYVGASATYLFVVDHGGLRDAIDLGIRGDELAREVDALRAPLARIHAGLDRRTLLADLGAFDVSLAQSLYRTLLAPAERHFVGAETLLVVPHGPLFQLPLEMLVKEAPADAQADLWQALPRVRFALQAAPPMMYAVSANLLAAGRAHAPDAKRPDRILALVNPRTAEPALQSGDDEAKALSAAGATVFAKEQATTQRLEEDAPRYDALYVSTHGEYDPLQPLASGFWLASRGGEKGTLVRASDVYAMRLRARVVVVRACESGRGQVVDGEGPIGLTRAFKFAGARHIVVGMWMLDDRSSAATMLAFMRSSGTSSYAAALRAAKVKLLGGIGATGWWAHPYFWAPMLIYI